jgi:hypothetical protein
MGQAARFNQEISSTTTDKVKTLYHTRLFDVNRAEAQQLYYL